MSKIKVMPAALANQIAAGEVIERPASVIKELVENAIDAGADQIDIRITEAGLDRMEVIDNGEGMEAEDLRRAFERHATSKLLEDEDLFRIRTLGFRGEALPSIASVSKMTIESSTGDKKGHQLTLVGGEIVDEQAAPQRKGTHIIVTDLFYNTPARLKHIRSLKTELSHIIDRVHRFAFAHPEIVFRLSNEGQSLLRTVGNGDLRQAIAGVYGVDVAKKMVEIKNENRNYRIHGYVSSPEITRASRNYLTLVVNQRVIKNYRLSQAVETGYGSKLMINRHPIGVIHIDMDPLLVDVNVHPTKEEVRLSGEEEIEHLIKTAVNEALQPLQRIPDALDNIRSNQGMKKQALDQGRLDLTYQATDKELLPRDSQEHRVAEDLPEPFSQSPESRSAIPWSPDKQSFFNEPPTSQRPSLPSEYVLEPEDIKAPGHEEDPLKTAIKKDGFIDQAVTGHFPELEYVGQAQGTYLIFQNEEGVYFVDQHAAQERIKYEYYREEIGKDQDAQQNLLLPIVLDYPTSDALIIESHLDQLESVGLQLENFGGSTFLLRSHPTWFIQGQEEATAREMIDFFLSKRSITLAEFREATAIMMSCKRSIKANHHLSSAEAIRLVEDLSQAENPYNCPHGRPVLVKLTQRDIEKMFKRIQDR